MAMSTLLTVSATVPKGGLERQKLFAFFFVFGSKMLCAVQCFFLNLFSS